MDPRVRKRLPAVLLGATALAFFGLSCASGGKAWWKDHNGEQSYGLELVVSGAPLPTYEHRGRSYTEGLLGERYTIRIHNRGDRRIEAVFAVDGRDAIDGQPADLDKRGYIVGPYSSIDLEGWRTSMDSVAAFRFTSPSDSYSARMGTADEVGIVEAAIFPEKEAPRPALLPVPMILPAQPSRSDAVPGTEERERAAMDSAAAPRSKNLGTQFGETVNSSVMTTVFERGSSQPQARLAIRYDDRAGLCHEGLKVFCGYAAHPLIPRTDHPSESREFAQPPPGWVP